MKQNKKSVLVVVAHRDDEVLGCGGTIAKLVQENYKVYAISMTNGISSRDNSSKKEIARGGRYDGLLKSLGSKKNISAVGAAINLNNLKT